MSAIQPLFYLVSQNLKELSKKESFLLEAELLLYVCKALKEFFRERHKNYFCLIKFTMEMEDNMLETNFLRLILQDILSTDEYSIEGIAHYIDTPEDVLQEIVMGYNTNPSAKLLQRVIELHRSVRRDLYRSIIKKMTEENLAAA
jgi:hypothetical protein